MISKDFVTAGRAVFTVDNGKGNWYTFRVNRKDAYDRYPETFFLSLLSGPDNTSDYTYIGILEPANGSVRLTAKSRFTDESVPVKVVRWAIKNIWTDAKFPHGYSVRHEGRCGRCGRALTVPESLETGIGPDCAGRLAKAPIRITDKF